MTRLLMLMLALCLGLWSGDAMAARRALVIGNGAYQHSGALPNPKRDAAAFAEFLRGTGFEVSVVTDATRGKMTAALTAFVGTLRAEDTALFYYSGHGMQMAGENYLLGVEAQLLSELDVPAEAVGLDTIVQLMEKSAGVSMIFIDACRNNPLVDTLALHATRGITRGLAPISGEGDGTMIAFAANPGQVAFDGVGDNSPFTTALIAHLAEPGVEIGTAFKRVIRDVREATLNRQSPQLVSSLASEVYLGGETQPTAAPPREPPRPAGISVPFEIDAPAVADVPPQAPVPAPLPAPVTPPAPAASPSPAPANSAVAVAFAQARKLGSVRALELFRQRYPDAGFDDEIAKAMGEVVRSASPEGLEARLLPTREARIGVQTALNGLGYDLGTPDGVFGPASRRAIAQYQRDRGAVETGFIDLKIVFELRIGSPGEVDPTSGPRAQSFDPQALAAIESDPRLLKAATCLRGKRYTYGFFEGHLYVAVQEGGAYDRVAAEAERCGGALVSIGSKEENAFVYGLVANDPRFFSLQSSGDDYFMSGPFIGLRQKPDGREPKGGWEWASGEPVTFSAWGRFQPDDFQHREDVAHFWMFVTRQTRVTDAPSLTPTWNDSTADGSTGYVFEVS